jgi:hypothetical protein
MPRPAKPNAHEDGNGQCATKFSGTETLTNPDGTPSGEPSQGLPVGATVNILPNFQEL